MNDSAFHGAAETKKERTRKSNDYCGTSTIPVFKKLLRVSPRRGKRVICAGGRDRKRAVAWVPRNPDQNTLMALLGGRGRSLLRILLENKQKTKLVESEREKGDEA